MSLTAYRIYTKALIKSVEFRCHYDEEGDYPTFQTMSKNLNKSIHKISFVGVRHNVGSTTFFYNNPPEEDQHSFGVPRFFFRLDLTSAIYQKPYAYVHWARFKIDVCHRSCFEGSIHLREWTSGPTERNNINPFCFMEDIMPSRFALGFDDSSMEMFFLALDPERVGLENIENGTVCDFGDNILDYLTTSGHAVEDLDSSDSEEEDEEPDDVMGIEDDHSDDSGESDQGAPFLPDLISPAFINFLQHV